MTETASATITASQIDPTHWQYTITLHDTGSTTLGTFWFAWVPGRDFLASPPSDITDPTGWQSVVTHGGSSDGYAIQWTATGSANDLASGGTLTGFSFVSTDAPSSVFGNSVFYPSTPVATSFVYSGGPFSDPGYNFEATAVCFLPGTQILTTRGEVAVEQLTVGDGILTGNGRTRPLCWIGQGRVLATRGRRSAATPVIVRKGAFADNVPHRDLRVTKGHSCYFDGVLIPVEFLINHRSILWDDQAQEVTLYHLELDAHDVLLANGAPAESYRDDGNRWLFQNVNGDWGSGLKPACAPVLTGGPVVDAVWLRLLDRAGPRPGVPLTDDADLHLLVDGRRVDASNRGNTSYCFMVPDRPREVRLVSRAASPQELGLARDPRCLGVAIRQVIARQGVRCRAIGADDPLLRQGFHGFEADHAVRWTDGDALLPSDLFRDVSGAFEVVVQLGPATRYVAETEPTARAA